MNKLLKKAIVLVSALAMSAQAYAAPFGDITQGTLTSPEDNVFRVWGDDNEFILLDVAEDDNSSKFFVMAKSYFSKKAYGSNQRFDPENSMNIAYFLNNEFLTKGITDSFTKRTYRLPQGVVDHIDTEHIWTTEAGRTAGNCPTEYTVKAGVALISQTEYQKYQTKIGMEDGFDDLICTPNWKGFWTRTGAQSAEMICVRSGVSTTKLLGWTSTDAGLCIRPVFWLDVDFFRDVAIDLSTAGENVKAVFKKYYTVNELEKIYPESWIYDYLDYTPDVSVKGASFRANGATVTRLGEGANTVSATAQFVNNLTEEISGNAVLVRYSSAGIPREMASVPLTIAAGKSANAEVGVAFDTPYQSGDYVKLYFSPAYGKTGTASNAVRLN